MHTILRTLIGAAAATGATAALTVPAVAGGAQHSVYVEEFDGVWTMDADENSCGPWPATLHEIRHGRFKIVEAPGGQVDGEAHVNGVVDGWFALDPDSAGPLPTYVGTYREKSNAIFFDEGERVAQYRLRSVARSADGSSLTLVLRGKVTFDAKGRVTSEHQVASCHIA